VLYLREGLIADTPSIAQLDELLFPENWMSAETIANELGQGPAFVFEDTQSKCVGYALTAAREGVLDLLRLGVHPSMQGEGVGRKLLERVLLVHHRLCVLTVRKDNYRAQRLYARYGFRRWGEYPLSWVLIRTS
jgi:[ribosomal protein S18]-alanine N-acetyltransferase